VTSLSTSEVSLRLRGAVTCVRAFASAPFFSFRPIWASPRPMISSHPVWVPGLRIDPLRLLAGVGLWAHLRPGSSKDNFASIETGNWKRRSAITSFLHSPFTTDFTTFLSQKLTASKCSVIKSNWLCACHCLLNLYRCIRVLTVQSRGLHFRHTDNINFWLRALEDIELPRVGMIS